MKTQLADAKKRQRRLRWAVAVGVALLGFLVHEVVGENGYLARREQHRRIQALSEQIEQLKAENVQVTERIQNLRSDPAAIEELAREQLHLGRPGEMIVAIPESSPEEETQPGP
jgi:cell division protein FtsB